MPSKLFQIAASAAQRAARQKFVRTPIGRAINQAQQAASGRGAAKKLARAASAIERYAGKGVLRDIERAGGIEKYALNKQVKSALNDLFRSLGPLGNILRAVVTTGRKSNLERQLDGAIEFLRAFGHEVIPPRGSQQRDRGLEAAVQALQEEGIQVGAPPQRKPRDRVVEPPPTARIIPIPTAEEFIPQIQLLPRPSFPAIAPGDEANVLPETFTPQSSNVFSFTFERESRQRGILYITYRQGKADEAGRKPNQRGPTYAYYNVPFAVFHGLRQAASRGTYIWDKIRVRGTIHGHQYPYNLVQGAPRGEGQEPYVPRKATPRGFRRRALASPGVGARDFTFSQLPERITGRPNRGEPNRGEPNRGR